MRRLWQAPFSLGGRVRTCGLVCTVLIASGAMFVCANAAEDAPLDPSVLVEQLRGGQPGELRAAMNLLRRMGARAVEPLLAALEDEDPALRARAATLLGQIGDGRARVPLLMALVDEEPAVRTSAVLALARFRDREIVEAALYVLGDKDMAVRAAAAGALGELKDAAATEALIARLQDDEVAVQQAAAEALGKIGDWKAVPALSDALRGAPNASVRAAAARSIGHLLAFQAIGALVEATSDEAADVSRAAIAALRWMTELDISEPEQWQRWWERNRDRIEGNKRGGNKQP